MGVAAVIVACVDASVVCGTAEGWTEGGLLEVGYLGRESMLEDGG